MNETDNLLSNSKKKDHDWEIFDYGSGRVIGREFLCLVFTAVS